MNFLTPLLVVLKGPPGIGKSTLASALADQLGWPVLDKDEMMEEIADDERRGERAYREMFRRAEKFLAEGTSVICDSPLTGRARYELARDAARRHGARLLVVDCSPPEQGEWERRIESRSLPPHRITTRAALDEYLHHARSLDYPIEEEHIRLDMSRPVEELVGRVCSRGTLPQA